MKFIALLLFVVCASTPAQTKTTGKTATSGPCSPSITGNNNTVIMNDDHCDPARRGITIRPTRVAFHPVSTAKDGFSETYRFRVQNNTDEDVYSVVFKLKSTGLALSNFRFGVPKSSQIPLSDDPALKKLGDIGGMDCTDSKQNPVWMRIISHLRPRDSREVTLTQLNPAAESVPPSAVVPPHMTFPESSKGVTVEAKIVGFSRDSSVLEKPGTHLQTFSVDEVLQCGSVVSAIVE